jgi:sulfate permease, SulP family
MSEAHIFFKLLKSPRSDVVVLLITFILTIVLDLTIAIEVGLVIAAFLFMYKMSNATQAEKIDSNDLSDAEEDEDPDAFSKKEIPNGVEVFEIYGSLFFGAADKVVEEFNRVIKKPKVLIIRMRNVLIIDATGLKTLENIYNTTSKRGTTLILTGLRSQVLFAMQRINLIEKIKSENISPNLDFAIDRAKEILYPPVSS